MANSVFYVGEKNFPVSIATEHNLSGVVTPFAKFTRPTVALVAAIADDGGIQSDLTYELTTNVADDIPFLPADAVAVGDAFYFATTTRVSAYLVGIGQLGIGTWVTVLEYWNGMAWVAFSGVMDGTSGFTVGDDIDGVRISFTIPTDWERTVVDGLGPFYFGRQRVTTGDPSPVQNPLGSFVRVGKDVISGSIVGDGTAGLFSVQIPQGLFDEPGQYRLQSEIQKAGSEVQKGNVAEFEVKKEAVH
jgi:hypothetical protein